jgi:uncharacterized protein YegL
MKNKFKKSFLVFISAVFCLGFFSDALAAVGDCGNNFSANFLYRGKRLNASEPFTTIVPTGYEFKAHLTTNAKGEGEFKGGENVEIVLVMDRSGSMKEKVGNLSKIDAAKNSLNIVADTFVASADTENRLALVTYNGSVTLDQSLTSNYSKVKTAISSFSPSGQTNISGALMNASNHLNATADSDAQKFIVIASDGMQNVGMPIDFGIKSVGSNTTVFAIGIGADANSNVLKKIAEESGNKEGEYYSSNVEDLTTIFKKIIEEILIPFQPENVKATFYRENADKFSLNSATPAYSTVSNEEIIWNNLGSMLNGEIREFDLIYNQAGGIGSGMPINTGNLLMNYNLFGVSCSEVVPIEVITIENEAQCIGETPANADLCAEDDENLIAESTRQIVNSCSNYNKCEYVCDPNFEFKDGKCVIDGKCGVAENKSWCRDEPTTGWCGNGSVLVEGPDPEGNKWVWHCAGIFGGTTATCKATRACAEGWKEVSL